jgi:hypothetical protein
LEEESKIYTHHTVREKQRRRGNISGTVGGHHGDTASVACDVTAPSICVFSSLPFALPSPELITRKLRRNHVCNPCESERESSGFFGVRVKNPIVEVENLKKVTKEGQQKGRNSKIRNNWKMEKIKKVFKMKIDN